MSGRLCTDRLAVEEGARLVQQALRDTVVWDLKVKGIGALVVSEDGSTVLGLISERDIVRGLTARGTKAPHSSRLRADDLPAVTCTPGESITAVMARMTRLRVRHLPVVHRRAGTGKRLWRDRALSR